MRKNLNRHWFSNLVKNLLDVLTSKSQQGVKKHEARLREAVIDCKFQKIRGNLSKKLTNKSGKPEDGRKLEIVNLAERVR